MVGRQSKTAQIVMGKEIGLVVVVGGNGSKIQSKYEKTNSLTYA